MLGIVGSQMVDDCDLDQGTDVLEMWNDHLDEGLMDDLD
jgi:hypothetical protein